jgi:hypothetical protein
MRDVALRSTGLLLMSPGSFFCTGYGMTKREIMRNEMDRTLLAKSTAAEAA